MPWKDYHVDGMRMEFVLRAAEKKANVSALCREYGISRKTGIKWLARYRSEGVAGLVRPKGRGRPRRWMPERPGVSAERPNALWTVDFKGWWRTGDGRRVEPLSVRDAWSRYLVCLEPLSKTDTAQVQAAFARIFSRYGLPEAIRSDNGAPFASMSGPHGLTRLSAWWRILGVRLERTEPGRPDQNGAHERLHGDVKREIQCRPGATWDEERARLERWRVEFNTQRPHEALGMKVPGDLYRRSERVYDGRTMAWPYPANFERRQVHGKGEYRFAGRKRFLSESLAGWTIGLEPAGVASWRIWFCDLLVGELDEGDGSPLRPPASAESRSNVNLSPIW